jgi:hypothetical protein
VLRPHTGAVRPIPGVGTSEDGADAGFVLDRTAEGYGPARSAAPRFSGLGLGQRSYSLVWAGDATA